MAESSSCSSTRRVRVKDVAAIEELKEESDQEKIGLEKDPNRER